MSNLLEQLKSMTAIVADTGDIEAIRNHRPEDATTNPSLLFKAATLPEYAPLITGAIAWAKSRSKDREQQTRDAMDKLAVNVGLEVLKSIPGRVSTEVDSRLSFDTQATLGKARKLIGLYNEAGIANERVLIKVASTWEGIRAAEILEHEGIHCNLTLMFGFAQARSCAEAGVTLISPFVGRIFDWQKAKEGRTDIPAEEDMGVLSVRRIYQYYKEHGYPTAVMGASIVPQQRRNSGPGRMRSPDHQSVITGRAAKDRRHAAAPLGIYRCNQTATRFDDRGRVPLGDEPGRDGYR